MANACHACEVRRSETALKPPGRVTGRVGRRGWPGKHATPAKSRPLSRVRSSSSSRDVILLLALGSRESSQEQTRTLSLVLPSTAKASKSGVWKRDLPTIQLGLSHTVKPLKRHFTVILRSSSSVSMRIVLPRRAPHRAATATATKTKTAAVVIPPTFSSRTWIRNALPLGGAARSMLVSPETPSMGRTFFSVSSASASGSTTTSTSPSFVAESGAGAKAFQTFQTFQYQPDMIHLRLPFGGGPRPRSISGAGMTVKHWGEHQRRDYGTVSDARDAGAPLADSQLIGKGRYVR
jgi:hypothetical protein